MAKNNAVAKQMKPIPGLEGVTQDLLIIPRLKLVQKNSVEIDNELAKPGQVVNSVTKEVILRGKEPIVIIPIKNTKSRLLFRPMGEGGGLLCQSFDGMTGQGAPGGNCLECPKAKWPEDRSKSTSPECADYINVFCVVRGYDFPIPLTGAFGKTSMGAGKQLVNFFWADSQKAQKSPWNFAYELNTIPSENEKGKFYIFKIAPGGKATKDEIEKGELFYNLITSTQIEIHEDEDEMKAEAEKMQKAKKAQKAEDDASGMTEAEDDPFKEDEE